MTKRARTYLEIYDAFVVRGGPEECWLWGGNHASTGYGRIKIQGKSKSAHRLTYHQFNGPIPDGTIVRHKCDVRSCNNPQHLELGTHLDNALDRRDRGRGAAGSKNGNARMRQDDVVEIRSALGFGVRQVDVAKAYGLSQSHVSRIKRGISWPVESLK